MSNQNIVPVSPESWQLIQEIAPVAQASRMFGVTEQQADAERKHKQHTSPKVKRQASHHLIHSLSSTHAHYFATRA